MFSKDNKGCVSVSVIVQAIKQQSGAWKRQSSCVAPLRMRGPFLSCLCSCLPRRGFHGILARRASLSASCFSSLPSLTAGQCVWLHPSIPECKDPCCCMELLSSAVTIGCLPLENLSRAREHSHRSSIKCELNRTGDMCDHVHVCVCVCMCVWRPEDMLRC